MKNLIILALVLVVNSVYSQSYKQLLKQIEGQWEVDKNGLVTYSKVIEVNGSTKDELYRRAVNYFTYHYNDGKSVIQSQDKEEGTVVGKGLFANVEPTFHLTILGAECVHILRIDVKDEKARITFSLIEFDLRINGGTYVSNHATQSISNTFPINQKSIQKNADGKMFYNSHMKVQKSFEEIEKALKEGNVQVEVDKDW